MTFVRRGGQAEVSNHAFAGNRRDKPRSLVIGRYVVGLDE
jgi:hypothetical protein